MVLEIRIKAVISKREVLNIEAFEVWHKIKKV
jgi:hypothetical protein